MTDLKGELASLKIDRDKKAASPWRWPLMLMLPAAIGILVPLRDARAPGVLGGRGRDRDGGREQGRRAERRDADPDRLRLRRGAAQGGRLRQDPGTPRGAARGGGQPACARARASRGSRASTTRRRSRAPGPPVLRAEADLAEFQRQLRLSDDLATREGRSRGTSARPRQSRVRIAEAQVAQEQADLAFAEAQLQNTVIRAPVQRASWSRRWPRWARASRRSRRA